MFEIAIRRFDDAGNQRHGCGQVRTVRQRQVHVFRAGDGTGVDRHSPL